MWTSERSSSRSTPSRVSGSNSWIVPWAIASPLVRPQRLDWLLRRRARLRQDAQSGAEVHVQATAPSSGSATELQHRRDVFGNVEVERELWPLDHSGRDAARL